MYRKGKKAATVTFLLRPAAGAKEVLLAGNFNHWQPEAMKRQKDGSFVLTRAVGQGTFEYKFVIDGRWVTDPDNAWYALNGFGTANSVAQAA